MTTPTIDMTDPIEAAKGIRKLLIERAELIEALTRAAGCLETHAAFVADPVNLAFAAKVATEARAVLAKITGDQP